MASKIILDNSTTGQITINNVAVTTASVDSAFSLSNSNANNLYNLAANTLNTSFVNLKSGLSSPNWAYVNSTSTKRSQFMSAYRAMTEQVRTQISYQGYFTTAAGSYPGTSAYYGGVLLQDGRVFMVPFNATFARIYNPTTDSNTTPSGSYAMAGGWWGGVLMRDGRVYMCPYNSTTARIYDPATDTLTTPNGTFPGGAAHVGGVLLPDGRVYISPAGGTNGTVGRIYDPTSNTLTTTAALFPSTTSSNCGCCLTLDGRVLHAPFNSTSLYVYDPVANSTISFTAGGTGAFRGAVLLPDGRNYVIPSSSTTGRIVDIASIVISSIPNANPSGLTYAHIGGVVTADGRVFCTNQNAPSPSIFDPITLTTIYLSSLISVTANSFSSSVLLKDGRVFMVPQNSTSAKIYTPRTVTVPDSIVLSPFLNKF